MMHFNRRISADQGVRAWVKFATYAVVGVMIFIQIVLLTMQQQNRASSYTSTVDRYFSYVQPIASLSPTSVHGIRNSFKKSSDSLLEPLNCLELLDSYSKKEIPQLKDHTDELPYHKSYLRLTKTEIPFYLSTNDAKVDYVRVGIFDSGEYYETRMTEAMQDILKYESNIMPANAQQAKPIMIDVGGNVGWFSMLSAAHGAEVYVFEPNVVNMVRLCESVVLNAWSSSSNSVYNQLHPFMKGVSNNHGEELQMYKVHARNPGSFTFSEMAAGNDEVPGGLLQLVSLDALAQSQNWLVTDDDGDNDTRIAILKIDVEGLELKVFEGAKELLKSGTVKNIFIEWKKGEKKEESKEWEDIFSLLLEAGYELYKIGSIPGPKDIVTVKFESGKELMVYLTSTMPIQNANLWIRLAES